MLGNRSTHKGLKDFDPPHPLDGDVESKALPAWPSPHPCAASAAERPQQRPPRMRSSLVTVPRTDAAISRRDSRRGLKCILEAFIAHPIRQLASTMRERSPTLPAWFWRVANQRAFCR
jgi:hypothetical protein